MTTGTQATGGAPVARATERRLKYTMLIMTLNEIDGMRVITPRIRPEWLDQIIVVDGGSKDGTIEYARERGYEVHVQTKPGFRTAYQEVWPKVRGDVVIYFTPDGNTVPEEIPKLIAKMEEGYDLVIGSRYMPGAKSEDDDAVTSFGNWLFRTLTNLFLRPKGSARMTDPMIMFRAHLKSLPHRLGLDRPEPFEGLERLFKTRVDWIPLMSMRSLKWKACWTEIPADEPPRIGGVRKLQILKWGAVFLIQLLREAVSRPQKLPAA